MTLQRKTLTLGRKITYSVMKKAINTSGFADMMTNTRNIREDFFDKINALINWKQIEDIINDNYGKGKSRSGKPSWDGIVLFKMNLIRSWYKLSDRETEQQVNDRISFGRFIGISLDDSVPDSTLICRFRNTMRRNGVLKQLNEVINETLKSNKLTIKNGKFCEPTLRRPRHIHRRRQNAHTEKRATKQNESSSQINQ